MCGRYTLTVSQRPELRDLGLQTADRYNIAPQTSVLVKDEHNQHRLMPWDYSPPWAKTPMHISNARSETLREKPSFRKARRCVFLADGWYEWQRQPGGKIPWFHHLQGELIVSPVFITTTAAVPSSPATHWMALPISTIASPCCSILGVSATGWKAMTCLPAPLPTTSSVTR